MGARVVVLMGVSGVGKTTVGLRLAERLGWEFHDGDDLHPPENRVKMAAGVALTDEDRRPWLDRVRAAILDVEHRGASAVVACSALKDSYRRHLLEGARSTEIVHLHGEPALIATRIEERRDHFFDPALLTSQLETLEEPLGVVTVDVDGDLESVVERVLVALAIDPRLPPP